MQELLEHWFHLAPPLDTAQLCLNRAWRQRIAKVQTTDSAITLSSVDWAVELRNFPRKRACCIAVERNDLPLLMRLVELRMPWNSELLYLAVKHADLDLLQYVCRKTREPYTISHCFYIAARTGKRDALTWLVEYYDLHWRHAWRGAAKHSAEMLQWTYEQEPWQPSARITNAAIKTNAYRWLKVKRLTRCDDETAARAVKYGRMVLFRKLAAMGLAQSDCATQAVRHSLARLEEVMAHGVQPCAETLGWAARMGNEEAVRFLHARGCSLTRSLAGATYCTDALKMSQLLYGLGARWDWGLPDGLGKLFERGDLPLLKWAESTCPQFDVNVIVELAAIYGHWHIVEHYLPRVALATSNLLACALSGNVQRLDWILAQGRVVPENIFQELLDDCNLEAFQWAHDRQLCAKQQPRRPQLEWIAQDDPVLHEWLLAHYDFY